MESNLNAQYEPTDDEYLFVAKIKNFEDSIKDIISPFQYLKMYKASFGETFSSKIEMIIEHMLSDYKFYMMDSGLLYGKSVKWLLKKQHKIENK